MGKPYKSELARLSATYKWALSLDTSSLGERVASISNCPMIAIGSGGSQSTALLVADVHQREFGTIAKADTPLVAHSYLKQLKSAAIVLVSSAGKNPDILGAARRAVECEPSSLIALCATKASPLSSIVTGYARGFCFDFNVPSGKDGFLATNSLLALGVVALKGYGVNLPESVDRTSVIVETRTGIRELSTIGDKFFSSRPVAVLFGADGRAAAADLESKLVEAGLVSAQLADYRNFAHGRHHWFAKHPESAVIALASERELDLARRTLALLPREVASVLLKADMSGPAAWVELQAGVFELIRHYGEAHGIDPGRPGVPEFGRRIYHLNAFHVGDRGVQEAAIARKIKAGNRRNGYGPNVRDAFRSCCQRLSQARFVGLVLDYDGTICDHEDRFLPIRAETARALQRLSNAGFLVGVATGRGKSIRKALRAAIPEKQWPRVWVGYYNGGVVAPLTDDSQPDTEKAIPPELRSAADALQSRMGREFAISVRPDQITIETSANLDVKVIWDYVVRCISEARALGVRVVASTRSVDVIPESTCKLSLLRAMEAVQPMGAFLCIGDRPRWPGNDAELLTHEFSLSVDEVDADLNGAWNLAPAGVLGSAALRYYLGRIKLGKKTFRIALERE